MTPIQQDPARRIRRIQRWLAKTGIEFNGIPCYVACHDVTSHRRSYCDCVNAVGYMCEACRKLNETESSRIGAADKLFATELAWLCRYAADVWNALRREDSNKAAIALDLERETEVLADIKHWASAEINELRSKLDDSEKARKSAEFYMSIHSADSQRAHTELLDARRTIAEQKARIEELESKVSGLREGLEDIKSMRRIANFTDMMEECDFYLNRDT